MGIQSKILLPVFTLFTLMCGVLIYTNYQNQKQFVEGVIEKQTTETVNQYFDSVNTLMITGAMDNREILRNKLLANPEIVEARIIRGKPVIELFGEGLPHEKISDELDKKALLGNEIKIIRNLNGSRVLTVLTPLKAQSNFKGTNCIECHQVPENTVLGVARVSYSLSKVDEEIKSNAIHMAKVVGGLFFFGLLLLFVIIKLITINKIKRIKNHIENISKNLDLTKSLPKTNSNDELAQMGRVFDEMIHNIHRSMIEVSLAVSEIIKGSSEISNISEQSIHNSVTQSKETTEMTNSINELAQATKTIAENTRENSQSSQRVDSDVSQGAQRAINASKEITDLASSIQNLLEDIIKLEEETKQIANIVTIIDDVTMKTKLLSFNASVEAGRAGEHGKGFSVVAAEIGELANATKTSTAEIANGTNHLSDLVQKIVGTIHKTNKLAQEGNLQVSLSSEAFNKVANEIKNLGEMNRKISDEIERQNFAVSEMTNNAKHVMELSNDVSDASKRIGNVTRNFLNLTNQLDNLMKKFKL